MLETLKFGWRESRGWPYIYRIRCDDTVWKIQRIKHKRDDTTADNLQKCLDDEYRATQKSMR